MPRRKAQFTLYIVWEAVACLGLWGHKTDNQCDTIDRYMNPFFPLLFCSFLKTLWGRVQLSGRVPAWHAQHPGFNPQDFHYEISK